MFTLGAVSSALDTIKSLTSPGPSTTQKAGVFGEAATELLDVSAGNAPAGLVFKTATGSPSQLAPATMSALLAAQGQSSDSASAPTGRWQALQDLFSQIDAGGDGGITKSEFENALGAGGTNLAQADHVFSKLDSNGDGVVTLGELTSALKSGMGRHFHHPVSDSSGSSAGADATTGSGQGSAAGISSDPARIVLGVPITSVDNSDGSTKTSVKFADGSQVTVTSPSASTVTSDATATYNMIEQMIQREMQAISFSATTPQFSLTT